MLKPNFDLKTMTTHEHVMDFIEVRLKEMYKLGLSTEERVGEFERLMLTHKQEISDKIEQFFLDNR